MKLDLVRQNMRKGIIPKGSKQRESQNTIISNEQIDKELNQMGSGGCSKTSTRDQRVN